MHEPPRLFVAFVLALIAAGGCQDESPGGQFGDAAVVDAGEDATPSPDVCGDGHRDLGEVCDSTDLGGQSCATVDAVHPCGDLVCNATCDGWLPSSCQAGVTALGFGRRYGHVGWDRGVALAVDGADHIYVSGTYESQIDFGGQPLYSTDPTAIYLAKLSPDGNLLWSRSFATAPATPNSVELFGGPTDLAVTADGETILVGGFRDEANFGGDNLVSAGEADVFVARFDADGKHLWSHREGGSLDDVAIAVSAHPDGSAAVTGFQDRWYGGPMCEWSCSGGPQFVSYYGADGERRWHWAAGDNATGTAAVVASDGDVLVAGMFTEQLTVGGVTHSANTIGNVVLIRFDGFGAPRWSLTAVEPSVAVVLGLTLDETGHILLAGMQLLTNLDFGNQLLPPPDSAAGFLARFLPDGAHLWSTAISGVGTSHTAIHSIAAGPGGQIAVTGQLDGTTALGDATHVALGAGDGFVARFDSAGTLYWHQTFGSTHLEQVDHGSAIALDSTGAIVATGTFAATIDLGAGPLTASGQTDVLVFKVDPYVCP